MTRSEKIVFVLLAILLFTGSMVLYARNSRPCNEIVIVKDGIKKELTLRQVEAELKENRRISINNASVDELTGIPGIGEVMATRIIQYRRVHGSFFNEDDLLGVKGIGEKKMTKMREFLKFE